MSTLQIVMFVMALLFWIPSITYIIYTYIHIKQSEIVLGKVIDIEPVYRGARYTLEIQYNNSIETTTISPNTAFQQYRINQKVELYRFSKNDVIRYYVKGSNYIIPIVVMIVTLVFFIATL